MFKHITKAVVSQSQLVGYPFMRVAQFGFANVIHDPTKNKYQENRMLFFADPEPSRKKLTTKPKTI
jgi:hypothetical protein